MGGGPKHVPGARHTAEDVHTRYEKITVLTFTQLPQPTRQIMRLAVDLGIQDELVFADHELPRCVYWEGK